ncbi:efflux RND transporter periplasmic adaptor subunit [Pseudomonas phage SRT6]|nr:efflux RND transporter periplasmic adaptor subunit [Pseudomonas phage SRT6]
MVNQGSEELRRAQGNEVTTDQTVLAVVLHMDEDFFGLAHNVSGRVGQVEADNLTSFTHQVVPVVLDGSGWGVALTCYDSANGSNFSGVSPVATDGFQLTSTNLVQSFFAVSTESALALNVFWSDVVVLVEVRNREGTQLTTLVASNLVTSSTDGILNQTVASFDLFELDSVLSHTFTCEDAHVLDEGPSVRDDKQVFSLVGNVELTIV